MSPQVKSNLGSRIEAWAMMNIFQVPEDVVEVPLDPDVVPQGGGEAGVPRRDPDRLLRDNVANHDNVDKTN